jgi:hypothetical protein
LAGNYKGKEGDHAFEGILDCKTGFDAQDGSLPFDAAEDLNIENVDLTMTENGSVEYEMHIYVYEEDDSLYRQVRLDSLC